MGFNAGDGVNYFAVPDSRTPEIGNIQNTSNVGTTGRWIFRIDQSSIVDNSCLASNIGIYNLILFQSYHFKTTHIFTLRIENLFR